VVSFPNFHYNDLLRTFCGEEEEEEEMLFIVTNKHNGVYVFYVF